MSPSAVREWTATPLQTRTLQRECQVAHEWASQYGEAWATFWPEPMRCGHGTWDPLFEDRPENLHGMASAPGVYLWHTSTGWHLTVAGPKGSVVTGSLMTDGKVAGVTPHYLQPAGVQTIATSAGLRFRLTLFEGTAGLDFRLGCGSRLTFTGFVGGRRLRPEEIFVGQRGAHPHKVPVLASRIP